MLLVSRAIRDAARLCSRLHLATTHFLAPFPHSDFTMVKFTAKLSDDESDGSPAPFIGKAPMKALPAPAHHYEDEEEDGDEEEEDAEMTDGSGSDEDSHMDEDELERSPVRRRRDRQALVKGPDGEYYQQHELDSGDDDDDENYDDDDWQPFHRL